MRGKAGILEKETPAEVRRFEVAFYDHPTRPRSPSRRVLIYDHGQERILIGPYIIARTREAVDTEVSRLRAMSWDAFREFARSSERRHYVLD